MITTELSAATSVGLCPGDDDPVRVVQAVRSQMVEDCGVSHSHEIFVPAWLYEMLQADDRIVYWATFSVHAEDSVMAICNGLTARRSVTRGEGGADILPVPAGFFARYLEELRR